MATESIGETPTLFLRKATGLVRGWSVRDSMIYACLATNVITLGIYEFSFQSFIPKGQLLTSILISAVWVSFLVIAYAGLIVTIPRAGGDYVWQSRILGSGLGFVMAATGWWFILWLWAPIYGNILSVELFQPLWATLGDPGGAAFFATKNGIFVVCLITIALAGILVSIGMAGYARIQKWCFYAGLVGFTVIVVLLLIKSHTSFVSSFNFESHKIFGVSNAYAKTNAGALKAGYVSPAFGFSPIGAACCWSR
jgi:APA family basic amino acid/polyamine antiporter